MSAVLSVKLAGLITRSHMGLLGNIFIGIIGSALGHHLADRIGLAVYGPVARMAVSVAGQLCSLEFCACSEYG